MLIFFAQVGPSYQIHSICIIIYQSVFLTLILYTINHHLSPLKKPSITIYHHEDCMPKINDKNRVRKRQVKCLICGLEFISQIESPRCSNKKCNSRKVVDLISVPTHSELYFVKNTINQLIDSVENLSLDQQVLQNNIEYLAKIDQK